MILQLMMKLKVNFKSIFAFANIKNSLISSSKFSLPQLPQIDKKLVQSRNTIVKTEWMSEELKLQMINVFNSFIETTKTRIETLNLAPGDVKLLAHRYEGMKIK